MWGVVGQVCPAHGFRYQEMSDKRENTEKNEIIGGFVDTFYHSLDDKRRLTLPREWRDAMGNPQYVYVVPDATRDCLNLVSPEQMKSVLDGLRGGDVLDTDPAAAALAQCAQMLRVDSAGRIRIGDHLLGFAGITGRVTLVGAFRKAEIWAGERKPEVPMMDKITAYRAAVAARRAARTGGVS